jgi:MFS family permease
MRAMITMAIQYMFLEIYRIPPMQASAFISYINLPWTPKLLYGIITDVFPICGSGKRSYVFLMGMLQALSCLAIAIFGPNFENAVWVMLLACVNSMGGAFMDVVVDGLMVINARKDPTAGSEELQAYSWGFYGAGGITGCLLSGYFLGPMADPYPCFYIMTIFGASVGIAGLFIDKSLEENQTEMV